MNTRQHEYCPDAPETWCKWKKQKAGDQTCKNYSHKKDKTVPKAIVENPIFQRLSDHDLLDGWTQNQNEALQGLTWSIYSKEEFVGLITLTWSANLAVCL